MYIYIIHTEEYIGGRDENQSRASTQAEAARGYLILSVSVLLLGWYFHTREVDHYARHRDHVRGRGGGIFEFLFSIMRDAMAAPTF